MTLPISDINGIFVIAIRYWSEFLARGGGMENWGWKAAVAVEVLANRYELLLPERPATQPELESIAAYAAINNPNRDRNLRISPSLGRALTGAGGIIGDFLGVTLDDRPAPRQGLERLTVDDVLVGIGAGGTAEPPSPEQLLIGQGGEAPTATPQPDYFLGDEFVIDPPVFRDPGAEPFPVGADVIFQAPPVGRDAGS